MHSAYSCLASHLSHLHSPDPPSPSIRIDHLLRPFHTRTLEHLLAKTGTVEHFWIDGIKSHCYATYASEAEASATREALFNLNWPEQGGKKLAVKFVPTDDVKTRLGLLTAPALERRGVGGAEADGVASGSATLEGETPGSGVGVGAEEKGVNGVGRAGVKEVFTVRNTAVAEPGGGIEGEWQCRSISCCPLTMLWHTLGRFGLFMLNTPKI